MRGTPSESGVNPLAFDGWTYCLNWKVCRQNQASTLLDSTDVLTRCNRESIIRIEHRSSRVRWKDSLPRMRRAPSESGIIPLIIKVQTYNLEWGERRQIQVSVLLNWMNGLTRYNKKSAIKIEWDLFGLEERTYCLEWEECHQSLASILSYSISGLTS